MMGRELAGEVHRCIGAYKVYIFLGVVCRGCTRLARRSLARRQEIAILTAG